MQRAQACAIRQSSAVAGDIDERIKSLVDAWCDRRDYDSLRQVLTGWPRTGGLTDDWALVMEALRMLRASDTLPDDEQQEVASILSEVENLVYRD